MGISGAEIQRRRIEREKREQTSSKLVTCKACGKRISKNAASCPACGEPLNAIQTRAPATLSENNILIKQGCGVVGAIILFIGVFLPLIKAPVMGSMNYFANGKGDGSIVLVFAVASAIAALSKKFNYLWLTGFSATGTLGYTYYTLQSKIGEVQAQVAADLTGNPFKGLADAAIGSVQLQWGVAVMAIGIVLIFAAAIIKDK